MLSEIVNERNRKKMKNYQKITVWAGAAPSIAPVYSSSMRRVGELLAEKGITMVYGIGDEGMMGAAFQGVRNKNGKVIGITTPKLLQLQCKDPSIFQPEEMIVIENFAERKNKMMTLGEAILVGPGGWGTLDEVSDFAVTIQKGEIEKKPLIFLNFNNFWGPFQELLFNMLQDGTLNQDKTDFIEFIEEPDEIFEAIEKVQNRLDAACKKKK